MAQLPAPPGPPPIPPVALRGVPAPVRRRKRLGEMLVEAAVVSQAQLEEALVYQKTHGGRLGSILVSMSYLSEADLEGNLARQLGLQVCEVESIDPPDELLRRIPREIIEKYEVVPLKMDRGSFSVGMTDPGNFQAIDELRFLLGVQRVDASLVTERTFRRFVQTRYASSTLMDSISSDSALDAQGPPLLADWSAGMGEADDSPEAANRPPVVRLVNYLLGHAVEQRASDIHLEPYESFFRVRLRVDGKLYTLMTPPLRMHPPVVSRIKVLAAMDVSEHRRPQDGHMVVKQGDDELHFRISTLPTVYGETCVIRLLKKDAQLSDLAGLGFKRDQLELVKATARLPQGLILVTGPTGSGKTTTVHAIINFLNEPDMNIVTLEDPVETTIPGVNHVQINEKIGVGFAESLASVLRQDPDAVFVGEMRDPAVAQIGIKAALTGHLVLSTLHTNGVVESFTRLLDMGVEPYLLASCLKLVLAQRLLRRLCTHCARQAPVPATSIQEFKLNEAQVETALHKVPVGCSRCLNTGYRGRVAVYESLSPDVLVQDVLRRGGKEFELTAAARRMNMVTMWQAGIARALAGETSFDEVRRVLGSLAHN